eukprot:926592-Rhodomonas_salina.2
MHDSTGGCAGRGDALVHRRGCGGRTGPHVRASLWPQAFWGCWAVPVLHSRRQHVRSYRDAMKMPCVVVVSEGWGRYDAFNVEPEALGKVIQGTRMSGSPPSHSSHISLQTLT